MSHSRGDGPPGNRASARRAPSDDTPMLPMGDAELLASSPFTDDLDSSLAARPARRSRPTLYLAAGIILVAGFLGGVQAQKWSSDGTDPSGGAEAGGYGPPGAAAGGGPEAGAPGQRGGGTTVGTVTKIVGTTLYLRTSSGQTVKVKTSDTTKVRITKDGALRDLGTGTTVSIRGTKAEDGTVTATTVNQGSGR